MEKLLRGYYVAGPGTYVCTKKEISGNRPRVALFLKILTSCRCEAKIFKNLVRKFSESLKFSQIFRCNQIGMVKNGGVNFPENRRAMQEVEGVFLDTTFRYNIIKKRKER